MVALALALPLLPAWTSAPTAQTRVVERTWPEEWPIDPAPLTSLSWPQLPPPASPLPQPANEAARRVVGVLARIRQSLRQTRYHHRLRVREQAGIYEWDCSLMVGWVLERSAPRARREILASRPLARHFAHAIESAPVGHARHGWQRLASIEEARPGDLFAWRRPDGFPSRNTGHVGFVLDRPRLVTGLPHAYAVQIADSTSSGHQNDTRPYESEGGFGIGTLVFLSDGNGNGTHYGWGGTLSRGYVRTPILFGRVTQ